MIESRLLTKTMRKNNTFYGKKKTFKYQRSLHTRVVVFAILPDEGLPEEASIYTTEITEIKVVLKEIH